MLRELLASFDIDTGKATAALKGIHGGIESAKGSLAGLAETLIGGAIANGFKSFVEHQIEAGSRVNDLSEKLGIGTEELQQFQFAAQLVGVEAEGAGAALNFLSKNMGAALEGNKEAVETFTKLGVDVKDAKGNVRELGDVLPAVADAFEGMSSSQERTAAAMKIFGKQGAALIPLLKDGSGGLKEMYEEFDRLGGGMEEGFIHAADEAGDEIDKLKFAMNGWKSQIAFAILPTITKFVKTFQGWVGALRQVTRETNLSKYAAVAFGSAAAAAFAKMAVGLAKVAGVIPKGGGFFKSLFSLGWIGLVIAAIVALGLVFEDLWVGMRGGQSVIRDWLTETLGVKDTNQFFTDLKTIVDDIKKGFQELGPEIKPILSDLLKMGAEAGPGIAKAFIVVVKTIAGAVSLLSGFVQMIAKAATGDWDGAGKAVDKAGDSIFGKGGLLGGLGLGQSSSNTADYMKYEGGQVAFMSQAETDAMRAKSGGVGSVTQTNTIKVEVNGGTTNAETGGAVKDGLLDALQGQMTEAMGASLAGG